MESAYRAWLRERRERSASGRLNELCRELQTALGTAKWQMEEFEKAVRPNYQHHGDFNIAARHRQFISAIESQISQVEQALRESFIEEGKQPFRWVNLNEEERDDLAAFLSGTCQTIQSSKDECVEFTPFFKKVNPSLEISVQEKLVNKEDKNGRVNAVCNWDIPTIDKVSGDFRSVHKDMDHVIEIKADSVCRKSDKIVSQTDRTTSTRKTLSPPNYSASKIVIAGDQPRNKPARPLEATSKVKGYRPLFSKQKWEEYPQAMQAFRMLNQCSSRIGLFNKQFRIPLQMLYGCYVRVTVALMLIIFITGKTLNFLLLKDFWPLGIPSVTYLSLIYVYFNFIVMYVNVLLIKIGF
ncbi:unnamed protein product [Lupinus luteus]|uniref:Syntaxin 6/10/61 N-terminal domain-containing protein n=1 Tax=Lupinus luteus TaxID=3873 RepID=A0AAV1XVI1_LUPLU